jgi:hypothetical protein
LTPGGEKKYLNEIFFLPLAIFIKALCKSDEKIITFNKINNKVESKK